MNIDISYYVSVFLRRIYVMIIVAVGFTAAAIYVAMELPPTYYAQARLLVESPQIPTSLAASTVQVAAMEHLQIMEQRLMTRDNLLQIAREHAVFPKLAGMTADEIVRGMRQSTRISQSGGRSQATFMTISFTNADGRTAAAVVNEYVTRLLEANRSLRTALAEETLDFFEQEADRLSEELARQSQDIVEFKRRNAEALPTSLQFRQDRQAALQERTHQISRELELLDDQEVRLREVFEAGGQIGEGEVSQEEARLQQLQADLDSALAVYSPTNPRIRILRAQIEQAEQQVLASAESDRAAAPKEDEQSPREAMLEAEVAEIETRRENLVEQRDFIEQELQSLNESLAKTPEVSAAIDGLEREYKNIQSQYNEAVGRLATAATGERIELNAKGERITVIEQATVPNRPSSPNRPLIAGAGALAGIGLGSALIFLLEFLNQSIRRPVDLERHLGVTPIATLPYIRTRREVIWKRLVLIALMAVVVIGGPAVIYLVHTYFMPIDLIVEKLLERVIG